MRFAALFVLALAVAGCEDPEAAMENTVRETLADRGNVTEVDMTQGEGGNMTGHAVVAAANGTSSRYNCTANKVGGGITYRINCIPALDEAQLTAIENDIRRFYEQRGARVLEVELQRHNDDNNFRGFIRGIDETGEVRLNCTGRRDTANNQFPWECAPEGQTAAPAAPAGAQPAAAVDAGGKDPAAAASEGVESGGGKPAEGEPVMDDEGGK